MLRLHDQGLSRNAIAVGYGMSKHSVFDVFDATDRLGVSYKDVETKMDDEVYAMLFPGRMPFMGYDRFCKLCVFN
ncbi:hypothetical protein [Bifidobacterium margollesii]|uniref:hypothetical protein n=1 Tax=Bifidobacterium margollesii TaxID=2020964 RepID=UPI0010544156|nr:hypothetical protein [Bifidobacterium margollesii]